MRDQAPKLGEPRAHGAFFAKRSRRISAKRITASATSSSVESSSASTPARLEGAQQSFLLRFGGGGEAGAEIPVMGVDEQLLAILRVLEGEKPQVGKPHLQGIGEAHRDHVMAAGKLAQRLLPARRADEIGNDEDQRTAADHARRIAQHALQVGAFGAFGIAIAGERVQQHQELLPAAARRDHALHPAGEEQGPRAVALARQEAAHQGGEFRQHRALGNAHGLKVDRRDSYPAGTRR